MRDEPVAALLIVTLLSASAIPAVAQTASTSPGQPQILPEPNRPSPPTGGPQIQPPRPGYRGPQIQPPRPGRPEIQPPRPGNGYDQTIRCESRNNRRQQCRANTQNRVRLIRTISGRCLQGRSWGFDQRAIWVDRGCRADFAYGRASGGGYYPQPEPEKGKGPSTGLIIGGVAVAAGLVALLASSANKKKQADAAAQTPAPAPETPATFPAGPPAALSADLSPLPAASRPSIQTCLREAARQIGATGGTRLLYDKLVSLEQGNGGWRFGASLIATYPDGDRTLPLYCRATPTKVIQLDFAAG